MAAFEPYPRPASRPSLSGGARNNGESGTPMATADDYDFSDGYEQPSFPEKPQMTPSESAANLGKAGVGLLSPDELANIAITTASWRAAPARGNEFAPKRPEIPYTYDIASFAIDTNAAHASSQFCTAWLELYRQQVKAGDFPAIKESRVGSDRFKQRLLPRKLAEKLPNGSVSEALEIFLTPELYLEYRKAGLIPDSPGGENGVPRIYWIARDGGDAYQAGTNADRIYVIPGMNPLGAATLIGTFRSVTVAIANVSSLLSTTALADKERKEKEIERRRRDFYGSYYR